MTPSNVASTEVVGNGIINNIDIIFGGNAMTRESEVLQEAALAYDKYNASHKNKEKKSVEQNQTSPDLGHGEKYDKLSETGELDEINRIFHRAADRLR